MVLEDLVDEINRGVHVENCYTCNQYQIFEFQEPQYATNGVRVWDNYIGKVCGHKRTYNFNYNVLKRS